MAIIYQKIATDKTLILSPREGILRAFDFGAWTEMRIGIFYSGVTSGGDNTQSVAEVVALSSPADRLAFGIKNSDTDDLPGEAGGTFLGASNSTGNGSECNGVGFFSQGAGAVVACAFNGATLVDGGAIADTLGNYLLYPANVSAATQYCGFSGLKLTVTDLGLSSQTVGLSFSNTQNVPGDTYGIGPLRTYLNNSSYGTVRTMTWNDGAAAYDLPDAFFLRMPFYNNRIRVSAMIAARYA